VDGPEVARWMAGELGLAEILPQRGWEALKAIGWSVLSRFDVTRGQFATTLVRTTA